MVDLECVDLPEFILLNLTNFLSTIIKTLYLPFFFKGICVISGLFPKIKKLDDGWPESAEEHVTRVLLHRECQEYVTDML